MREKAVQSEPEVAPVLRPLPVPAQAENDEVLEENFRMRRLVQDLQWVKNLICYVSRKNKDKSQIKAKNTQCFKYEQTLARGIDRDHSEGNPLVNAKDFLAF